MYTKFKMSKHTGIYLLIDQSINRYNDHSLRDSETWICDSLVYNSLAKDMIRIVSIE